MAPLILPFRRFDADVAAVRRGLGARASRLVSRCRVCDELPIDFIECCFIEDEEQHFI